MTLIGQRTESLNSESKLVYTIDTVQYKGDMAGRIWRNLEGMELSIGHLDHGDDPLRPRSVIVKDTVEGKVLQWSGRSIVIKPNDGEAVDLVVDSNGDIEIVDVGDKVKARVSEKGHVDKLQREKHESEDAK